MEALAHFIKTCVAKEHHTASINGQHLSPGVPTCKGSGLRSASAAAVSVIQATDMEDLGSAAVTPLQLPLTQLALAATPVLCAWSYYWSVASLPTCDTHKQHAHTAHLLNHCQLLPQSWSSSVVSIFLIVAILS